MTERPTGPAAQPERPRASRTTSLLALVAVLVAEARLNRADRPQFVPIRRALARDIERLKSVPAIDFPGMSMRLDSLVASVDGLPLAYDERTERSAAVKGAESPGGFWSRIGGEI